LTKELDPAWGPFLFDTSAESWLDRNAGNRTVQQWLDEYLARHEMQLSAITVLERVRGYARLGRLRERETYLRTLGRVWPVDTGVALAAAEILALVPEAPSPGKRTHRMMESRAGRLSRWRFDVMIASTALVTGMPLVHDNAADFEAVRTAVELAPERFPGMGSLSLIRVGRVVGSQPVADAQ
jgi:predicted nucleic acid-binding protein